MNISSSPLQSNSANFKTRVEAVNATVAQQQALIDRSTEGSLKQRSMPSNPDAQVLALKMPSTVTTTAQLKELNPKVEESSLQRIDNRSIRMFEAESPFIKPLEGTRAFVSTKAISLGNGLSLPVGTKIYGPEGIVNDGAPTRGGYTPQINARLPNGKVLTFEGEIDKKSALPMTKIKFDDGKSIALLGTPFFNPKTGELGRAYRTDDISKPGQDTYRLSNAMFNPTFPARNGYVSGADAQKSFESMLR